MLVVNAPPLAEAIERLSGEWLERFGGQLIASASDWELVAKMETIDADLIVFPARYLGELAAREHLRPVRAGVLESPALDASDYFPQVRHELITWGDQTMALPLSIRVITSPNDAPPGLALLLSALPKATTRDREGVLFDSRTMKPRIAEPAFVDALQSLVQSQQQTTGAGEIPILDGTLAAVTSHTRNAASAFQLLEWLASAETSTQLARATPGAAPARTTLVDSANWYGDDTTMAERIDEGRRLQAALDVGQVFVVPRIPGIDDYLTALDAHIESARAGSATPAAALQQAAERWDEITNARGRTRQRAAYLKHLGIDAS